MKKFNRVPNSSEIKEGEVEDVPVIDEELRLITSQLEMVDNKIADIDPRIHRGGQNAVVREVHLTPEDINNIEEDTIDLKAVREDLLSELEEYYSTRTNQLEREVKQEVEYALGGRYPKNGTPFLKSSNNTSRLVFVQTALVMCQVRNVFFSGYNN